MSLPDWMGTRASLGVTLELLLGLLILGLMLAGVRQAWLGRRVAHVRTMKLTVGVMGAFLLLFLVNLLTRGSVEALDSHGGSSAFLAVLTLHVLLSLAGGAALIQVIRLGLRTHRKNDAIALRRHRRLGNAMVGFWLVNGLLGALVYLIAYIL